VEDNLAQLRRILARCDQGPVAAVDFHAIAAAGEWNGADMGYRGVFLALRQINRVVNSWPRGRGGLISCRSLAFLHDPSRETFSLGEQRETADAQAFRTSEYRGQ
jgi:hypothetical protein